MPNWSDRFSGAVRAIDDWSRRHAFGVAAATLVVTALLVLLGWYTAAIGAGATCNESYPGCAGQLSPIGLSIPQFVEWVHRFAAMLVGYGILGNAIVQWRADPGSRVSRSAGLAALLLPLQVIFGAVTVTISGLVPGGYAPPSQVLHLGAALGIFVALVASLIWLDSDRSTGPSGRRMAYAAAGGIALAAVQLAFARGGLFTFRPLVQVTYNAAGLCQVGAFVTLALWARDVQRHRGALAGAIGAVLAITNVALIVGVVPITRPIELLALGLVGVQALLFVAIGYAFGGGEISTPMQRIDLE